MSNIISRFQEQPLLEMDDLDELHVSKNNMFTKVFPDKYPTKFSEIFFSPIKERDQKMKDLYEESKNDESLEDNQKKLMCKCFLAYNFAVCKKALSLPLIDFVDKKTPNLTKYSKPKRINRTIVDLDDVIKKSGFYNDNYTLLHKIRRLLKIFTNIDKDEELDNHVFLFLTAISRFSRNLSVFDYANIWYVSMLIKQIESYAYINIKELQENNDLIEQIQNLVKTIVLIKNLEDKRLASK